MKEVVAKTPILGSIINVLADTEKAIRKERQEAWAEYFAGGDDPEDFADTLEEELTGAEGATTRSVVMEGARAALDAVEPVVVPSIGRLTRHRYMTRKPSMRVYRDLLEVLRCLDVEEFEGLRRAAHTMVPLEGAIITTYIHEEQEPEALAKLGGERWVWHSINSGTASPTHLIVGDVAPRIVRALATITGDYHLEEPQRARNKPRFDREFVELLAEIMPLPR